MIGADVLGDAPGFALRDPGLADGVQQRGLAVVDVAHDGDHRRPGFGLPFLPGSQGQQFLFLHGGMFRLVAEFAGHDDRGIEVDGIVDVGHHAHVQQLLDDFAALDAHALGQFAHGDGFAHLDTPLDGLGHGQFGLGHLFDGLFHALAPRPAGLAFGDPVKVGPFPHFPFLDRFCPPHLRGLDAFGLLLALQILLFFDGAGLDRAAYRLGRARAGPGGAGRGSGGAGRGPGYSRPGLAAPAPGLAAAPRDLAPSAGMS